jgi:DUF1707 SHOCT-like domain
VTARKNPGWTTGPAGRRTRSSYDVLVDREVWSSFTHDPRDTRFAPIRASDQDRSLVQQVLDEAYADGRLDRDEYDERSERATQVRVLGDLIPLLNDLIAPPVSPSQQLARASRRELEQRAEKAWRTRRREAVFSFLGPSLVTTAIWFATSWGEGGFHPYFFWPGFVIVFTLLHLVRTATRREEIVEEEIRRLEKRRAKELRSRPRPDGTPQ